jgi:hypothetical protein
VAAAKNPVILTACHIQKDGIDVHVMTTKEASGRMLTSNKFYRWQCQVHFHEFSIQIGESNLPASVDFFYIFTSEEFF